MISDCFEKNKNLGTLDHPCGIFFGSANLESPIRKASELLKRDGFIHNTIDKCLQATQQIPGEASTSLGKAIESVKKVMQKLDHRLYQGLIYQKCQNGTFKVTCTLILLN